MGGSSVPSSSSAYGYDKAGNRTQEQIGSATTTSAYNVMNQLTSQSAGGLTHFTGKLSEWATVTVGGNAATVDGSNNFDGAVSLTTGTNTVPIVASDASGNTKTNVYRVVVPGGAGKTLTYDLNGNMVCDGTNNYQWDAANRLVAIWYGTIGSSASTGFAYDGLGRRTQIVGKNAGGTVTSTKQFVWDGINIAEERDAGNNVTKRFYPQGEQIGGTAYFYTKDHLGSIREMTDSSGTIHARYDYDLWGRLTKVSGDMDSDFAYTGHYWHQPSGLYLAPFRAYNADLGRWLSPDPIGEAGGINLYDYTLNDPVNAVDPDGLYITYRGGGDATFWANFKSAYQRTWATPSGKKLLALAESSCKEVSIGSDDATGPFPWNKMGTTGTTMGGAYIQLNAARFDEPNFVNDWVWTTIPHEMEHAVEEITNRTSSDPAAIGVAYAGDSLKDQFENRGTRAANIVSHEDNPASQVNPLNSNNRAVPRPLGPYSK